MTKKKANKGERPKWYEAPAEHVLLGAWYVRHGETGDARKALDRFAQAAERTARAARDVAGELVRLGIPDEEDELLLEAVAAYLVTLPPLIMALDELEQLGGVGLVARVWRDELAMGPLRPAPRPAQAPAAPSEEVALWHYPGPPESAPPEPATGVALDLSADGFKAHAAALARMAAAARQGDNPRVNALAWLARQWKGGRSALADWLIRHGFERDGSVGSRSEQRTKKQLLISRLADYFYPRKRNRPVE